MMNKSIYVAVGLLTSMFAVDAYANFLPSDSGKILGTSTSITPNNEPFHIDTLQFLVGDSSSSPCSDLHVVREVQFDPAEHHEIEPMTMTVTSDNFLAFGPALSCFELRAYSGSNEYSTGNVLLTWDDSAKEYTAMTPRAVVTDFTK